ncbi:hypothetical protein Tco_0480864 [Tanacetum coccineum]
MARMDAMTMKMDAQYKEFQSRSKQLNPDHNDDDIPMSREEEDKFMQTFRRTRFYNDYHDRNLHEWGFAAAQAVLITGASQSRQHGKSESDLTSHPPQSLFDVGSRRIAIVTGNTLSVLAISQG